jgi:tetratricopeptide (TPR) repeat protein
MLNLSDRLLAMGRNFQRLGRHHDALKILSHLAGFHELPAKVAEETQHRLAELQMRRGKFRRARRHLAAALLHRPESARYHWLMARSLADDKRHGDAQRAADHYRKSLQIDPDQAECLAEWGRLALRMGHVQEGLDSLCRAVQLAPQDPRPVSRLVRSLAAENRVEEALAVLRAALFRNPRDRRFRRLYDAFQFQQLVDEQAAARASMTDDGESTDEPDVLPFVRPARIASVGFKGNKLIRRDGPHAPRPHRPVGRRLTDRRHA